MLFSLPTLSVKGHGTKERVTGLLGRAGDGEGGRRGPLAHFSPQDQLRLSLIPLRTYTFIFITMVTTIIIIRVCLLLSCQR